MSAPRREDPAVEALAEAIIGAYLATDYCIQHGITDAGEAHRTTAQDYARAALAAIARGKVPGVTLARPRCDTCGGTGVVPEEHDGGTHPVHCPEGCDLPRPGVTLIADRETHPTTRLTDEESARIVSASIAPDRVLAGRDGHEGSPPDVLLVEVERILAERTLAADREPDALAAIAAVWDLPPTCTCPDDCDCGGRLVCTICLARNQPHHEGREDHADLHQSLAAKSRLRDLAADREPACTCGAVEHGAAQHLRPCPHAADREPDGLRAAVEALAGDIKRAANDDWTAHSEAADMGDLDAANIHGEAGEVRDDIAARLRALLAAHPATDRGEVGTGAGEGAPRQDTGSAWVTRSTDCPEAPARAHLPAAGEAARPVCQRCGRQVESLAGHFPSCPPATDQPEVTP